MPTERWQTFLFMDEGEQVEGVREHVCPLPAAGSHTGEGEGYGLETG